jgi:hypothetical protein
MSNTFERRVLAPRDARRYLNGSRSTVAAAAVSNPPASAPPDKQTLLPLPELARAIGPIYGSRPLHVKTLLRWILRGRHGVRLRAEWRGRHMSCLQWVDEFWRAEKRAHDDHYDRRRQLLKQLKVPAGERRAAEKARRELEAKGLR